MSIAILSSRKGVININSNSTCNISGIGIHANNIRDINRMSNIICNLTIVVKINIMRHSTVHIINTSDMLMIK